jgi:PmbA protein
VRQFSFRPGRQQSPQHAKQLAISPACGRTGLRPLAPRSLGLLPKARAIELRKLRGECLDPRLALAHQPLAPHLDAPEALRLARGRLLARGERGFDRRGIDIAHQLADVLPLPRQARAAGDGARKRDRIAEPFRQPHGLELRIRQADQCLAKILRSVSCALARALARRKISFVLVRHCYNSDMQRDLQDVVALALEEAKKRGATQAEVDASMNRGLSVTVRLGEVDTVEYQRDRGVGVTVYHGKRKGSASTADLSAQAVRDTVEKAATIARYTTEDPFAGLADPEHLAREIPDLDLDHPWDLTPDTAVELARGCEAAGLAVDARITNSEGATVGSQRDVRVYGNSHGFLAGFSTTGHTISCVLLAQEGEDMQRDYWFATARDATELVGVEIIGRKAGERALARLGAHKLTTRKSAVLFAPEMARGLFGHFIAAIRGGAQYRKSSFLLGAAGQAVFPEFLQMQEQPHIRKGLASSPFDDEGVATRDRELVRAGVLQGYVLGSYSARKLGLVTTGNAGGIHNMIVSTPGKALDFDSLLKRMHTGFLVTELMGQGVNAVTGDYSRGASGYWIENGALSHPVHEVTIAGNLKQMYRDIEALGTDVDARGAIRTGSVLVREMTIAGD